MRQPIVDVIRENVDLVDLVREAGADLRRGKGLCPFHLEKTASFVVYSDGRAHCFGCGWDGDVFAFIMKLNGVDFREALASLADRVGIDLGSGTGRRRRTKRRMPRPRTVRIIAYPSWTDHVIQLAHNTGVSELVPFAAELGVSCETLRRMGCFLPKEWPKTLGFPMRRASRKVVGVRVRPRNGRRKWALEGSRNALFIPTDIDTDPLFVVEGPTDTAAMIHLGFSAIGRPDAQSAMDDAVRVAHGRDVVLLADNDKVGIESVKRLAHKVIGYAIRLRLMIPPAGIKDARAWVAAGATCDDIVDALDNATEYRIKLRSVGA